MLLLLVFNIINNISAKTLSQLEYLDGNGVKTRNGEENDIYFQNGGAKSVGSVLGDPLWVFHLNNDDWMDSKLALGTSEDQEDFYNAIGPMMRGPSPRDVSTKVINRSNQHNPQNKTSERDVVHEITMLINKFALYTSIEPDSYLSGHDRDKDATIAIYFKGPYSCLIVILGDKQWHYILQTQPFPAWFYETHDTYEAPLKIPDNIRYIFFQDLLRLLNSILSYPL